jgi:drug/metabolite transporter (DMT)-like permease
MRWLPLALVVLSNVAYHYGQKSVPRPAHPVVAAIGMYVVALLGALALLPFVRPLPDRAAAGAALHWSVALVGLGILGVEIGFLLVYRAGWEISTASLTASVVLALALVPIGVALFREPWNASRLAGLALALAGLWLLNRR